MREFMKRGCSPILSMAGAGQSGQIAVVQGAVDNLVGRGQGVGQHVGLAVVVHVGAVVRRRTRSG